MPDETNIVARMQQLALAVIDGCARPDDIRELALLVLSASVADDDALMAEAVRFAACSYPGQTYVAGMAYISGALREGLAINRDTVPAPSLPT